MMWPCRSVSMRPSTLANSRSANSSAQRRRLKAVRVLRGGNSSVNVAMLSIYEVWPWPSMARLGTQSPSSTPQEVPRPPRGEGSGLSRPACKLYSVEQRSLPPAHTSLAPPLLHGVASDEMLLRSGGTHVQPMNPIPSPVIACGDKRYESGR